MINAALWKTDTSLRFLLGDDPTDSSIINVDSGEVATEVVVQGRKLENLMSEIGVEVIDYLKLDAEGAEPEVLEGIADISVRKIAVDCNPEREGESTADEVTRALSNMGFEIQQDDSGIFFARRCDSEDRT